MPNDNARNQNLAASNQSVQRHIANAAMHINDALKEEGNGEVSAVLRERLKKFEVANTWIKDTAWGFSITYRKSQTIPGSAGYVIPAGTVGKFQLTLA